jgi:hypothetical protein
MLETLYPKLGLLLGKGIASGHWTLEDLDRDSPGVDKLERDRAASAFAIRDNSDPYSAGFLRRYPPAPPRRNVARDWIQANAAQWEAMLQEAGK